MKTNGIAAMGEAVVEAGDGGGGHVEVAMGKEKVHVPDASGNGCVESRRDKPSDVKCVPLKPCKVICKPRMEEHPIFVKVCFRDAGGGSCVRRFPLPRALSFALLTTQLLSKFKTGKKVSIEYRDDEGDFVRVSSDVEVVELYRVVSLYGLSPLHIRLVELDG